MADVFLSYKREDAPKVRKLVDALRGAGLDAWWDEDIPGGAQWEATIEKALADAKAVIVCWSPESIASENVRSEARLAREDGRLVQVFLKPCTPPLFFGERQGFDLTKWRGAADDPRIAKVADCVRKVAAGERAQGRDRPQPHKKMGANMVAAISALLLLIAGMASWWMLRPTVGRGPMTLAVLPFRALNPADANLVDAIWDDTRGAISRNPNLRVLGRETVTALAGRKLDPAGYKRKAGADYLLDGSVQHVGDQVQMKLSLLRTEDGAEVWSDQLGGKFGDVFAFQQRIAREVEGRIRGRVAPGGGTTARNISTSAEVYALFGAARTKLLQRRGPSTRDAIVLLKKAVALDPNYAPAWADLGEATKISGEGSADEVRKQAKAYVDRALTLAPNLAHAHAVLGFLDCSPESQSELRHSIALDPNEVEGWMWLGNCLGSENRVKDALAAHSRAVEIEPLWFTSMYNKMDDLEANNDRQGIFAELHRAEATGDALLTLRARGHAAWLTGQIAEAARNEFEIRRRFPDQVRIIDLSEILMTLGFIDETAALLKVPASETKPYRGIPLPAQELRKRYPVSVDFWNDEEAPLLYGRLLSRNGRLAEYVGWYKSAFRNADDYYASTAWAGWERFVDQGPNVAANLRAAGETELAQQIIDKEESLVAPLLRNGPANWQMAWRIAMLRAVEGRDDEAVAALRRAIGQGWLPNRFEFSTDLAEEPCFARLSSRPDFQAIRQYVLHHIAEQRRQITPAMLANAGLALKKAA
ncbi:MAG TPA: TIR domain-containing protein [Sphingomicrobium sp.]|nr:TIR domain-containing protein [Sphingomicrobium sp.]